MPIYWINSIDVTSELFCLNWRTSIFANIEQKAAIVAHSTNNFHLKRRKTDVERTLEARLNAIRFDIVYIGTFG